MNRKQLETTVAVQIWACAEMDMAEAEACARDVVAVVLEEAAKECERQRDGFLSEQYAAGQPISSMLERFACTECAAAIRKLGDTP